MKIALAIFRYFPFGGLQRDFMRIAEEMLKRGHDVTVFTSSFEGTAPENLKVVLLPLKSWSNHARGREFEKKFAAAAAAFDVKFGFNRMKGLDYYFAADNCLKMSALAKYPAWYLLLSPRHRTFLRQEYEVAGAESSTKILYIVKKQKDDFQRFYGTPEERFFFLPPGLNDSCFRTPDWQKKRDKKRAELGLQEDDIMLIIAGSVFKGKGIDRFIRSVGALPEELKSRTFAAVAGNVENEKCCDWADRCGVAREHLILPGAVQDMPDWLLAADLMVHPARNEATGTVIIESIAAGTPVAASGECGFAFYAAESGGVELPVPFEQNCLDDLLPQLLQKKRLAKMKDDTVKYGANADFRRRAACAVDIIEGKNG